MCMEISLVSMKPPSLSLSLSLCGDADSSLHPASVEVIVFGMFSLGRDIALELRHLRTVIAQTTQSTAVQVLQNRFNES